MASLINDKLMAIRKTLGLRQEDIEQAVGYRQGDISQLENGKKKFLEPSYLTYLSSKGVNLSDVFNDAMSVDEFIARFNHRFGEPDIPPP